MSIDFSYELEYPTCARKDMDEYFMPIIWIHLFGVMNEGNCTQYNFVFHEPGKSNSYSLISSSLPGYMFSFCITDYCSGQSKNLAVVSYRTERVVA